MAFELAERLPERHPADAEPLREHALCGQAIAGRQLSALDRVLEGGFDLRVGGTAPGLDRSFRERHYGLDFSMVVLGDNEFHPLWLRDNCQCPECRHESGQRLLDTRSLPDDLSVVTVSGYEVSFSDGHTSVFDPALAAGERRRPAAVHTAAVGRRDPGRAADCPVRRGLCRRRAAPALARVGRRARLRDSHRRADRAGDGDAHGRALRVRARDELRPSLRREDGRQPDEPRVHGPRPRCAHGQSVSRADADAAAAALSCVERGRRREHARRLVPRRAGPAARRFRRARAYADPVSLRRCRHRARGGDACHLARRARRRSGRALQHAFGAAVPPAR